MFCDFLPSLITNQSPRITVLPTKSPTRQTIAEVNLSAIAYNAKLIKRIVGERTKIMAIVKANAYGHGLVEVSKFLQGGYVDQFGVALPEEGKTLREAGIRKPITVFTLPTKSQASLFYDFDLQPTISSVHDVHVLESGGKESRKKLSCHLKIDTGLNRVGVRVHELSQFISQIRKYKKLEIHGVYTHFATAELPNKDYAKTQFAEFQLAREILRKHGVSYDVSHCANSAAILNLPETYMDMVRPGISLYGIFPARNLEEKIPLKPALRLKTFVSLVKWIDSGESVSYGRKFVAKQRTQIATLMIGYADGYSRLLSNRSSVLIHGEAYPIVGNICMDQLMVDIGNASIKIGDEAVLIGNQSEKRINVWDLADHMGTIPYELLCNISQRVPRVYK